MQSLARLNRHYKCLTYIGMLYVSLDICCPLFTNKWVSAPFGHIIAATILGVGCTMLSDIVAEVYGYQLSMFVFILSSFCKFIVLSLCQLLSNLPSTYFINSNYGLILHDSLGMTISSFVLLLLAKHINAYLLTKWKILLRGKFFWLRSVGSSAICEIIYSLLVIHFWFFAIKGYNYYVILPFFLSSISYRIFFTAMSAFPSTVIVALLKRIERFDIYENPPFNPFKLKESS